MFRMRKMTSDRYGNFSMSFNSSTPRYFNHNSGPSTSKRSYYEILGVNNKATSAEIKNAFLTLSKKYHPDMTNDKNAHERFVEINEAYAVLSKNDTRQAYDSKLASGRSFGDNGDFTRQQQPRPKRPVDPIDDFYRRYFDEIYRKRYSQQQQQQYGGQRQDSPFRSFRDPPIWPDGAFKSQGAKTDDEKNKFRTNPRVIGERIFRFYFAILIGLVLFQALFNSLSGGHTRPYGPRKHGELDPHLEGRWRNAIIVDRPDSSTKIQDSTKKTDQHKEP